MKYTSNVLIQSSSTSLTNDNNSSEITEVSQYEHAQISRKVYQVLKVLKSSEIPLSQNELIRNLAFDVFQDTLLFNALIINEKISFNEKEKTFSYKPVYDLTCKEDLLRILKDASRFGGVDATELYDSWSLAKETLLEMEIEYSALLIKNKDGIPRLCFWNDPSSMLTISNGSLISFILSIDALYLLLYPPTLSIYQLVKCVYLSLYPPTHLSIHSDEIIIRTIHIYYMR